MNLEREINQNSEMPATANILGQVVCPNCEKRFKLSDRKYWSGYVHITCGQRIKILNSDEQAKPIWCVVGNIAEDIPVGEGGETIRKGTKHFSPKTKVYCYPPLWGDGYEKIKVIARHRGSRDLVTMIIKSKWLINCRAKLVYKPQLLNAMSGYWDDTEKSKKIAMELAAGVNARQ